jgi:hypothetical protein
MKTIQHSIFREDAVRRYLDVKEKTVLPWLVRPRIFLFLWIMLGLIAAAGFVAWFTPVPVYASGPAVALDCSAGAGRPLQDWPGLGGAARAAAPRSEVVLIAFLPARCRAQLRVGQRLFLRVSPMETGVCRSVTTVLPGVCSPDAAQQRFRLTPAAARRITEPTAIVVTRGEPGIDGLPDSTNAGSLYQADVEVGARRLVSYLPLVGRFFR